MPTRCNVVVIDDQDEIILYHHCDGYPNGVGKELMDYLTKNNPKTAEDVYRGLVFKYGDEYEIEDRLSGDIDYRYVVTLEHGRKRLQCFDEDSDTIVFDLEYKSDDVTRTLSKEDVGSLTLNVNISYDMDKSDIYKQMPTDFNITEDELIDKAVADIAKKIIEHTVDAVRNQKRIESITINTVITNDTAI